MAHLEKVIAKTHLPPERPRTTITYLLPLTRFSPKSTHFLSSRFPCSPSSSTLSNANPYIAQSAGGKAKPLKAAKKDKKELDDDDLAYLAKQKAGAFFVYSYVFCHALHVYPYTFTHFTHTLLHISYALHTLLIRTSCALLHSPYAS